jgi:hypothetical protein
MAAFALLNGARVIAYVPQIRCLNRDNSNAAAVSLATWALFTLANAATVTYAIFVINDLLMAGMFMLNLLGCLTIVFRKRHSWSRLIKFKVSLGECQSGFKGTRGRNRQGTTQGGVRASNACVAKPRSKSARSAPQADAPGQEGSVPPR